jgi:hypothetical protein
MPAPKQNKIKTQSPKKKPVASKKTPVKQAKTAKSKEVKDKDTKPKVVKAKSEKAPKTKVEKVVKPRRAYNDKPTLSEEAGINFSASRVKYCVANTVLNCAPYYAIKELKEAKPHVETKLVDEKEVTTDVPGVPISKLSDATINYIEFASNDYKTTKMNEYAKTKVAKFSEAEKTKYATAKKVFKDEHDRDEREKVFEDAVAFDNTTFNKSYDATFYNEYETASKAELDADERSVWKRAIDLCTKEKTRYGQESRTILTTFAEYISMQIIQFGIRNCVASGKKIMKVDHLYNQPGSVFVDEFTLLPICSNLQSYQAVGAYLHKVDDVKVSNKAQDEESDSLDVPSFDLDGLQCWNLTGDLSDTQMDYSQFCYYIGEITRTVRKQLAATEVDANGAPMEEYHYVSVSKDFKTCVSAMVTEILCRVARMIAVSIKQQGIKTVNNKVVESVLWHYFICIGVNSDSTFDFIRSASQKHKEYILKRQEKRSSQKSGVDDKTEGDKTEGDKTEGDKTEGDMTYDE